MLKKNTVLMTGLLNIILFLFTFDISTTFASSEDINGPASINGLTRISSSWGTSAIEFDENTGTLTVFSGTLSSANNTSQYIDNSNAVLKKNISKIIFSGHVIAPIDSSNLFSSSIGFQSLKNIEGDLDTSDVTDMSSMFSNNNLDSVDISNWDTSNVINMNYTFSNSSMKNLDVSNWKMSNVANMIGMFSYSAVTSLDVSNWDTSNVTDMSAMFSYSAVTSLDVNRWNTSNVTDMSAMFMSSKLLSLDVSSWDTSSVTDMSAMFFFSEIVSLDIGQWNVSSVINMTSMFDYSKLTYLNIEQWDTTNIPENSRISIFGNTPNLRTLKLGQKSIFSLNASLPDTINTPGVNYTGRWIQNDPSYDFYSYSSSSNFMSDYNGTHDGEYIREIEKVPGGDISVFYKDTNGESIAPSRKLSGNVGDSYTTEPLSIDGYTLDKTKLPVNVSGIYTKEEIAVTYVYKKNTVPPVKTGSVITNFVDEEGKSLKSSTQSGNIGDSYTTEPLSIDGYTLDKTKLPMNASGIYTEEKIIVTYVYKKNKLLGSKSPNDTNVVNKNSRLNSSNDLTIRKNSFKKILPQTGEKQNYLLVIFGFIILAILSIIYWYKKAKNQKEG